MPTLLGLNSGTSADGVDAVVVSFEGESPSLPLTLRAVVHHPHPTETRAHIEGVIQRGEATMQTLCHLNAALGHSFAQAAARALEEAGLPGNAEGKRQTARRQRAASSVESTSQPVNESTVPIDVAGMHGQTVWHLPPQMAEPLGLLPSTLQIGDASVMADRIGYPVASDFRVADVAAGGQGAPLTAILDHALFTDANEGRLRLNLGGIANVTWLPPGAKSDQVVAFDTGPANTLLDQAVRRLTGDRETCDRGGARAKRGRVHEALIAEWLRDEYFQSPPPKTTGRELFGPAWVDRAFADAEREGLSDDDLIATLTALTPASIAHACRHHLGGARPDAVIVHGGGAHNPAMMEGLRQRLVGSPPVATVEQFGIPVQALEPVLFALLGWKCLRREPSFYPRATGAQRPAVLGKIAWPAR
jgi:anhydro-N-acetylmuramic acid kinase